MKIRNNIRFPCPECGSQKVHRIFTGNSVLFTIFITVMAGSSAYLYNINFGDRDIMVIDMVIIAIGAFGLIPLVENIKFPKYKCKNCGYIYIAIK